MRRGWFKRTAKTTPKRTRRATMKTSNMKMRGGYMSGGRFGGRFDRPKRKRSRKEDWKLIPVTVPNNKVTIFPTDHQKTLSSLIAGMHAGQAIKHKHWSLGKYNLPTSITGRNETAGIVEENHVKSVSNEHISPYKRYKTVIHMGRRNSKHMRDMAGQFGTEDDVIYDSATLTPTIDQGSGPVYNFNLNSTLIDTAFNTKKWFILQNSFASKNYIWRSVYRLSPTTYNTISNRMQKAYFGLLNNSSCYSMMNLNSFLPIKIKAHVLQTVVTGTGAGTGATANFVNVPTNIFNKVCNNTFPSTARPSQVPDLTLQQDGAIPVYYQYGPIVQKPAGDQEADPPTPNVQTQVLEAPVTKNASLFSSSTFLSDFKHIKTVEKILSPRDKWDLHITNHWRSGVPVDKNYSVWQQNSFSKLDPIDGMIVVFELIGTQCDLFSRQIPNGPIVPRDRRVGTSPGFIKIDFQSKIKYIKSATTFNPSTSEGGGLADQDKPYIRFFEKQPPGFRELPVANAQIIPIDEAPTGSTQQYSIAVTTKDSLASAGEVGPA